MRVFWMSLFASGSACSNNNCLQRSALGCRWTLSVYFNVWVYSFFYQNSVSCQDKEPRMRHAEKHRTQRIGWLRAAVLGANDGIVSTASLVLGVAAAGSDSQGILVAGVAGLVAGAMSMAAGEYVSVSSQADTERADLAREKEELATGPEHEQAELTAIYVKRGLDPALASNVATQLMQHDAPGNTISTPGDALPRMALNTAGEAG